MNYKPYRYRLEPSLDQVKFFKNILGSSRFVWNWALAQRKAMWEATKDIPLEQRQKHSITAYDQMKQLTFLKQQFVFLAEVPNCCLQQVLLNLEKAFKRFFSGKCQYPRFKKKGKSGSFRFPNKKNISVGIRHIKITKIPRLKYNNSRRVEGEIRNATVTWDGLHWHVCIMTKQVFPTPAVPAGKAIGIDLGVAQSITTSDGRVHHLPVPTDAERAKAVRLQRRISRRHKGSNRREKAKKALLKFRHHLTQRRLDAMHKATTQLAKNHSMLVIEDLQVKNMTASAAGTIARPGKNVAAKAGLNRSILSQAFGEFRSQLTYKCGWYGSKLVAVPAAYTSQRCSKCGHTTAENRPTQAAFVCVSCRHSINADLNAAHNILAAGRVASAQGAAA